MLKDIKENPKIIKFKADYPTTHVVLVILAIIMLWRGVWGLLDVYLFPGSPFLSYGVSLVLGVLMLYIDDFHIDNLKR